MKKVLLTLIVIMPFLSMAQTKIAKAPGKMSQETDMAPSEKQIDSLELSAIQKIQSFYKCISVNSNPDFHEQLRDEATKHAKQLFYGDDCTVEGKSAKTFIDSCSNLKKKVEMKPVAIKIKQDIKRKADVLDSDHYEGLFTFKLASGSDTSVVKYAYVVLAKPGRQSALSIKDIWSVFISGIR